MVTTKRMTVTLLGGAPWGFRLAGGGALPLSINKIRKKSAAHKSGVKEGDAVISINGIPVHDKSHDEALELVEHSGESLTLEIFRGDMADELSRKKPKKTIQIGGGAEGELEGGLVLTATIGEVSDAGADVQPQVSTEASTELILTASIDDTSADSYPAGGEIQGFTATVGDVSESSFENTSSGFTMTASADDVTSSSIMVDSITAEVGDLVSAGVDIQAAPTSVSPNLAQPFTDSKVIAVSPSHLTPQPRGGNLSPRPISLSPKPVSFSPQPKAPSPRSPFPPSTSPKPISRSPRPDVMQPIVQNTSPKPFQLSAPSPNVSSTTTTSTETFDDGRGRIKRETVFTTTTTSTQQEGNATGPGKIITKKGTKTTVTTKSGSSLVKHQASAFDTPPESQKNTETPQPIVMQETIVSANTASVENNNMINKSRNGPLPFSAPPPPPKLEPLTVSTFPPRIKTQPHFPSPVFKPTKFVMGRSRKDTVPLNYPRDVSPKTDVSVQALYQDGKENVQPMFMVKNIVGDKGKKRRDIWKPNVWLPGQQLPKQQHEPLNVKDDFSPYNTFPVPQVQVGVSLTEPRSRSDSRHRYEIEDYEEYDEVDHHGNVIRPNRLHIFAPPVEIHAPLEDSGYPDSPYSPYLPYREDGEIDVGYDYEQGPSSPDSSVIRRRKNLYSDSAFYDTPGKNYPTINEQMKLCKIIANSLTSQANRRARGAKMFMRRKRKSTKWVHDGHSEWSSSAGDVANIHDLDSELSVDDGGSKPLFYFKIPNLKNRISSADRKMALTQEQFERLRLQSHKCDHKNVPPTTCFNIVEDLKSSRGKGGRMFEKRKVRVEKYVVDEKNARYARPHMRLENALNTPIRQEKTPWEAAIQHGGNVDAAFSHIDEMDRNQKLNQILKYPAPKKLQSQPKPRVYNKVATPLFHSNLKTDSTMTMVRGKNFNRTARGWGGGGEYPVAEKLLTVPAPVKKTSSPSVVSAPGPLLTNTPNYGDYNPKIKAWQSPGTSPYVSSASSNLKGQQQQQASWGHQSWHPDMHQTQRPINSSDRWRSQDDIHMRPKSWVSDNFDASQYKDEYDYTYVPVDYKFSDDYPSSPAYKQPIIPGTDL